MHDSIHPAYGQMTAKITLMHNAQQFTTDTCFLACDMYIHPMYQISLMEVSKLSFLIEESLSSFLNCRFFTRLYQTVQLHMY